MSVLESEDDEWRFRELLFNLCDLDLFVLYDFEGVLDRDLELDNLLFVLHNLDLLFALFDHDLEGDLDCDLELDDAWRLYLCTFDLLCFVLSLPVCLLWEDQQCELDDLEVDLDDDLEVDLDSDLECLYDLLCDFFFTIFESELLKWHWTDLDLEADLEELLDAFLGDFFTIFESDFLERRRTDLDLEADPDELGDLFTFDLEDLELASFDGSAACDLDSVSDLKISAASPVPFFFSVPEVVCLGLLDCFCLLPDIFLCSPWDIGLKVVLWKRSTRGSWTSEAAANISKLLLTGDVDFLFGSKPRSCSAWDPANISDTFELGDSCLDLGEFNVKGCQMSVSGSDGDLDLDSPDANVIGCQGPVFGFDGDLDRMDALWWAKLISGSHESVLGTNGRQRRSMSNGSCFGTEKSIKSKTSKDRLPRRAKLNASLLTTPYVSLNWTES